MLSPDFKLLKVKFFLWLLKLVIKYPVNDLVIKKVKYRGNIKEKISSYLGNFSDKNFDVKIFKIKILKIAVKENLR